MRATPTPQLHRAWRGALAFFVLAALTGSLYRISIATGSFFGLELVNMRHAHSHAMYFGWVTPALMALIACRLPALGAPTPTRVRAVIATTFLMALIAFPPFLLFGYSPAQLGEARLPLSVIAAGLNVLAWYAFVGIYWRARSKTRPSTSLRFFDAALFFLVLATIGAWGLPFVQAMGIDNPALKTALTHVFLDVFSEGWFVLGVLGLAASGSDAAGRMRDVGLGMAAAGIPFTFALGLPASLVPPLFRVLAGIGAMLVAVGLLIVAWTFRSGRLSVLWRFALACLVLKATAQGVSAVVPEARWSEIPQLRIVYLHVMLLGFVSTGLVAAAKDTWGRAAVVGSGAFMAAVGVLLASLLPLTPLWPPPLRGEWAYSTAAVVALGPAVVAAFMAAASKPAYPGRASQNATGQDRSGVT